MKSCGLVLKYHLPQNFYHTYTDRDFPKTVKLCSLHLKMSKFIKNSKPKIFMKPILPSIYIEESKKGL